MAKSLTEAAKTILMKENTNLAATLKPGSGPMDPPQTLGSAEKLADPVVQPMGADGGNLGAAASSKMKKDTSVKSSVPAEAPKKQAEVMEEDVEEVKEENSENLTEEDVELSEELESFIDKMVAEGATDEQIAAAIEENFEIVSEEVEEDVMEGYKIDMSEHVNALLEGEELSEDFRAKATAIFEAAVKEKVTHEIAVLEEAYAATLAEELESLQESMTSDVDDYLNYVVEQWTSENEVAIEAGLRSELTEDFISGLRNLFAEHYIDIPEDKVSVVEELGNKVEELETKLNEEIERNITLNKMLNESKTNEILTNACEGLTDTQVEKLKSLAEGIEYGNTDEYAQKISILRENYFSNSVTNDKVLDSADTSDDGKSMIAEELKGPMASYVRTLGKTLPR